MSCKSGTSYNVQAGDTLYKIAQQKLGDGNRWHEILNPDGSPITDAEAQNLHPGQEICLPGGGPPPGGGSGGGFGDIVSSQTYAAMFPNRAPLYTYDALIEATQKYRQFCNAGSDEQRKREAAAFLAHISHETGGLYYVEEQNPSSIYCDPNSSYPCAPGKTYHGRGPIQLSWNYNYGACSQAIGKDLLNQPELVSTDSVISFTTALWFWMTPQSPKPSCHDAIGTSGFGMTINIINGGIECGKGQVTPQAQHRIELYQQFAAKLGVTPGENLSC